jgi:hypothetical protein
MKVSFGVEPEGHDNNGEWRFKVEQPTPTGCPLDDASAPVPAIHLTTVGWLKSTQNGRLLRQTLPICLGPLFDTVSNMRPAGRTNE